MNWRDKLVSRRHAPHIRPDLVRLRLAHPGPRTGLAVATFIASMVLGLLYYFAADDARAQPAAGPPPVTVSAPL
jgi:hypothetical protein